MVGIIESDGNYKSMSGVVGGTSFGTWREGFKVQPYVNSRAHSLLGDTIRFKIRDERNLLRSSTTDHLSLQNSTV